MQSNGSGWGTMCSTGRRNAGMVRIVQEIRCLNALQMSHSSGLGDLFIILDEMGELTFLT